MGKRNKQEQIKGWFKHDCYDKASQNKSFLQPYDYRLNLNLPYPNAFFPLKGIQSPKTTNGYLVSKACFYVISMAFQHHFYLVFKIFIGIATGSLLLSPYTSFWNHLHPLQKSRTRKRLAALIHLGKCHPRVHH